MRTCILALVALMVATHAHAEESAQVAINRQTTQSTNNSILVIFLADDGSPFKAANNGGGSERKLIDSEKLAREFQDFIAKIGKTFNPNVTIPGGYAVEEIQLQAGVTAEGSLALFGTGGKLAGTTGITIILKRPKD